MGFEKNEQQEELLRDAEDIVKRSKEKEKSTLEKEYRNIHKETQQKTKRLENDIREKLTETYGFSQGVLSTEEMKKILSDTTERSTEDIPKDEIGSLIEEIKHGTQEVMDSFNFCAEEAIKAGKEDGEEYCVGQVSAENKYIDGIQTALELETIHQSKNEETKKDPKRQEHIEKTNQQAKKLIEKYQKDPASRFEKIGKKLQGEREGKEEEEIKESIQKIFIERYKEEFEAYEKTYNEYIAYIESKKEAEVEEKALTAEQILEGEEEEKTETEKAMAQFEEVTDQLGIELLKIEEIDENKVTAKIETTGGVYRNIEIAPDTIVINDPEGEMKINITEDLKKDTKEAIQKINWEKWFEDQLKRTPLSQDQEAKIKKIPEEVIKKLFTKLFSETEYDKTKSPSYIQRRKLTNLILYLSLPDKKYPTIYKKIKFLQSQMPGGRAEMEGKLEK